MLGSLLLLSLLSTAAAQQSCPELGDADLRGLVAQGQTAVDRGDSAYLAATVAEVEDRVPCLTFAPSSRLWAQFLVLEAVLRFQEEADWRSPLRTALSLAPEIDRMVSRQHPISQLEPAPLPEGPRLPEGRYWLNGRLTDRGPPDEGMHLFQREDPPWFASRVLEGEAPSQALLETPAERPPRLAFEVETSVEVGAGGTSQVVHSTWETADVVPRDPDAGATFGLYTAATATFYSPYGVRAEVSFPPTLNSFGLRGSVYGVFARPEGWVGLGMGAMTLDWFDVELRDDDGNEQLQHWALPVVTPAIGGGFRSGRTRVDVAAGGRPFVGYANSGLRYHFKAVPVRPFVGMRGSWTFGQLDAVEVATGTDVNPSTRRMTAHTWRALLSVGIIWGEP